MELINNCAIKINDHQSDIMHIYLKISTEKLDDDVMFEEFFPYKILKNIEITTENNNVIFRTNGMIIKSIIDTQHKFNYQDLKYGYIYKEADLIKASQEPSEFIIPIFLKNTLYVSKTINPVYLKVNLNDYLLDKIKIYYQPLFIDAIQQAPSNNIIKTAINQMEIIKINEYHDIITYNSQINGVIDHLLFYVDGKSKVSHIKIILNNLEAEYSYKDLNALLPYYYFGRSLPKNYMFLSYSQNKQFGLALHKIDKCEIIIYLKKNDGGNIYIMSQNKNLIELNGTLWHKYDFGGGSYKPFNWDGNMLLQIPCDDVNKLYPIDVIRIEI